MELFLHQVLAGLATGGIYACVALAVVMIYQAIDHLNFAQGEMAMFSTFVAWQLMQWGAPYWIAFVLTVALSFLAGVADGEDLIAGTQVADAIADGRNHAGEIPSEDVGEVRDLTGFAVAHLPVRAVDAGGDDVDHHLAGFGDGIQHVAAFENLRPAVTLDVGSFHGHSPLLTEPASHV